jgi:hypothetical protein
MYIYISFTCDLSSCDTLCSVNDRMIKRCEAVEAMRSRRRSRDTTSTPAPMLFYRTRKPHYMTWDRTRAASVESQGINAWDMVWSLAQRFLSAPQASQWELSSTPPFPSSLPITLLAACFEAGILLDLFDPEDRGDIGWFSTDYTASHPGGQYSPV